jgi:hypothetical protein
LFRTHCPQICRLQERFFLVLSRNWVISLPVTTRASPMVYGCIYCARSYNNTFSTLKFAGLLHSYLHLLFQSNLLGGYVSLQSTA